MQGAPTPLAATTIRQRPSTMEPAITSPVSRRLHHEAACNYDDEANYEDGSCEFVSCAVHNPMARDYDPTATISAQCQDFTSCVGCTDPEVTITMAATQDGNCLFLGCTVSVARNYDASANSTMEAGVRQLRRLLEPHCLQPRCGSGFNGRQNSPTTAMTATEIAWPTRMARYLRPIRSPWMHQPRSCQLRQRCHRR